MFAVGVPEVLQSLSRIRPARSSRRRRAGWAGHALEQRLVLSAAPTLDAIADVTVPEDSDPVVIPLTGITAGDTESQPLRVTAFSWNTNLVVPSVSYSSPENSGELTLTISPDVGGTVLIVIQVTDAGDDLNFDTSEDNGSLNRLFEVQVGERVLLSSETFYVDARTDLSHAGRTSTGQENRRIPVEIPLPDGDSRWVEFTEPAGLVRADGGVWPVVGSDGGTVGPAGAQGTNVLSERGISGIITPRFQHLSGVFLGDSLPVEEETPARIDFRVPSVEFADLQPELHQSFFVGDGARFDGRTQRFSVPSGATRLFLGFLDAVDFGWPQNGLLPGAYWDNQGIFSSRVSVYSGGNNDLPQMSVPDPLRLPKDSEVLETVLTGLVPGAGETQPLEISVSIDDPSAIDVLEVTSVSHGEAVLRVQPAASFVGDSVIRIRLEDAGLDHDPETRTDNGVEVFELPLGVFETRVSLSGPATVVASHRPTLTWEPVPSASGYDVWINNVTTGEGGWLQRHVTTTSLIPEQDAGIGMYDAWVRALQADGSPWPWSPLHRYRVSVGVDHSLDQVEFEDSRPQLDWESLPGAATYDFWLNQVNAAGNRLLYERGIDGTAYRPTEPFPLGVFNGWVRGVDVAGRPAAWSSRFQFTVSTAPQPVGPVSATFERTPEFQWEPVAGAESYQFFLQNVDTNAVVVNVSGLAATSYRVAEELPVANYRWWVRARGAAEFAGNWSAVSRLHVGGRAEVVSPLQRADLLTFRWKAVEGAVHYTLWVDRLDVPQSRVVFAEGLTGVAFDSSYLLEAGGRYRIWVQAVSSDGVHGPWSRAFDFTRS